MSQQEDVVDLRAFADRRKEPARPSDTVLKEIHRYDKASPDFKVIHRGLIDYAVALDWQRQLAEQRAKGLIPDTLLLLEHPHVVTRGRGANGYTIGDTPHPICDVERGGDVTYHGPGQLIGYPIIQLKERNLLVGPYLRLLENLLIEAAAAFGIEATRQKGFTGVWVGEKKLASIGIAVRSWVAYHGFALNVSTDLSQFAAIYPCGLQPDQMTSMENILGRTPDIEAVRRQIEAAFHRSFSRTPLLAGGNK